MATTPPVPKGSGLTGEKAAPRPDRPRATGVVSVRQHLIWIGLSALLLALAFPRPSLGALAFVALVPMTAVALRSGSQRVLAIVAYLVWFVWWLVAVSWLIPVTFGGWIGACAVMAAYFALVPLLVRRLDRQLDLPSFLALPLVWVSLEWVRGWFLAGGFGWFALSYTQAPDGASVYAPRLIQVADLGGEWTVSFLLAMTNGLIVDLVLRPWYIPIADGSRRLSRRLLAGVAIWSLCLGGALIYGDYRVHEAEKVLVPGPRVAVVQTNIPQSNKTNPTVAAEQQDWADLLALTAEAAVAKPDLLVWPETIAPVPLDAESQRYVKYSDPTRLDSAHVNDQLEQLVRRDRASVLVGAHAGSWQEDGTGYMRLRSLANSVFLYTPRGGQSSLRYDKIHRVPFGEFIPWIEDWPWLKRTFMRLFSPYGEDNDYTVQQGTSLTVFDVPWSAPGPAGTSPAEPHLLRCATPICFEDTDARLCAKLVYRPDGQKRADALINLTNDGWFALSRQQSQHLQSAVFRCIENRVPMARSVNTGASGFIDSLGRVGPMVVTGGRTQGVSGWAGRTLLLDGRTTWFGFWGDWPVVGVVAVTAALLLAGAVSGRRRQAPGRRRA
jgi:apolipoprotein N-acyltransferase